MALITQAEYAKRAGRAWRRRYAIKYAARSAYLAPPVAGITNGVTQEMLRKIEAATDWPTPGTDGLHAAMVDHRTGARERTASLACTCAQKAYLPRR